MGQQSKIEWTDNTWNPWIGCEHVSPGCDNCYMFTLERRWGRDPEVIRRAKEGTFRAPLKWNRQVPEGQHELVFTCSLSDFFIKAADEYRADAYAIIRETPRLCYQILTKRPVLMFNRLPSDWDDGYANVWLGVSAENQQWGDRRWGVLGQLPARRRFISYEPALGPLSVRAFRPLPDWVIIGGESGRGARPFHIEWAMRLIEECRELGVKCFVKQIGSSPFLGNRQFPGLTDRSSKRSLRILDLKGGLTEGWPPELEAVREFPPIP